MDDVTNALRRVVTISLSWASLWFVFWAIVMAIIGAVDPESIDPGEGPAAAAVLGPMGLLSGLAFAILLTIGSRGRKVSQLSLIRAAVYGLIGTAIVQLGYLGHGDRGLTANLQTAMLFSVLGGVVTMVWLAMARGWSRWHSSLERPPRSA